MKMGNWEITIQRDVRTHNKFICVEKPSRR